jgi:hypothetical protein
MPVVLLITIIYIIASGRKCPLTDLAKKYGAEKGYVFDTFLPESLTKYTFRFFGLLLVIGLILLAQCALKARMVDDKWLFKLVKHLCDFAHRRVEEGECFSVHNNQYGFHIPSTSMAMIVLLDMVSWSPWSRYRAFAGSSAMLLSAGEQIVH